MNARRNEIAKETIVDAQTKVSEALDFRRFGSTTIDVDVMSHSKIALVGSGGGRLVAELLTRTAISSVIIVDPDIVDGMRNPLTQGHDWAEHGRLKVEATATRCRRINPNIDAIAIAMPWDEATEACSEALRNVDALVACTDSYNVNRAVRQFGLALKIDVVEGWIYPNGDACEHVVTWPDVVAAGNGCGTCHLWMRHRAYENGFKNASDIPTYAIPSAYSSVQTAQIVVSRLHQRAGSQLPIVGLAAQFQARPAQVTRLNPSFWAHEGEPFADTPEQYATFMTCAFEKDWPADWICPDCGTIGTPADISGLPQGRAR